MIRPTITTADGKVLAAKIAARCIPTNSPANIGLALDYPDLLTIWGSGHYGQQLTKEAACDLIQTLQYWVATGELPAPEIVDNHAHK